MNFDWLKNIFQKNKNVGLAKLNTASFRVLRLSKLNGKNKERALSFLKEINVDNYESVLKYSEELKDKTNQDIDLLFFKANELKKLLDSIKSISEIEEFFSDKLSSKRYQELKSYFEDFDFFKENGDNKRKYYNEALFRINLLKEEIDLLKTDILKTEITAELKLIAFNEFIRIIKRKNYSFNKDARKIERVRNKNRLEEENERLKNLLMVIRYNLEVASRITKLDEYDKMIINIENYVQSLFDPNCLVPNYPLIKSHSYKYFEDTDDTNPFTTVDNRKFIKKEFKKLIDKYSIIEKFYQHDSFVPPFDINFLQSLENEVEEKVKYKTDRYNEVLNELAKFNYLIDRYIYLHRFDYKLMINEMNEIINRCHNTLSNNWDRQELAEAPYKYDKKFELYCNIWSNYINDNIKNELKATFLKLEFLSLSFTDQGLSFDLYTVASQEERIQHFDNEIKDLIRKITKDSSHKDFFNNYSLDYEIFKIRKKEETHYLVDFARGDYSYFDPMNMHDCDYDRYIGRIDFPDIIWGYFFRYMNHVEDIEWRIVSAESPMPYHKIKKISFEDICHYLKNICVEEKKAKDVLYDPRYDSTLGISGPLKYLIFDHWFSEFDKTYDEKIMILPSCMRIRVNPEQLAYRLHPYRYKEENKRVIEAIYLQTTSQLDDLRNFRDKFKTIKYVFISETALKHYYESHRIIIERTLEEKLDFYQDFLSDNTKAILVPDDIRYQELFDYINMENKKKELTL